ncbi:MAG TPA: zf-HC2 domain-containing protein, partial [Gaiellaceae bacterium]|nr:zf-HC2 domain-containing protein [Gaiellaceae bacterium]
MRCGPAQTLMAAAVDGELSPHQRRQLDEHLAGCAACRAEHAATARVLGAVDLLATDAEVPVALEQATLRRVRTLAAEEAERRETRWW